jgi:5-methyltetrahydropteroyltriglutamate--homocysteine methyltransferase
VAREVFARCGNFALFLLEYDDWRSGSFEPLRLIPRDKGVALGLVSTKRSELEPFEAIANRIEEAASYFPRERLALSTQCGFGTVWEGNPLTEAVELAKLQLVAQVAKWVWPQGPISL